MNVNAFVCLCYLVVTYKSEKNNKQVEWNGMRWYGGTANEYKNVVRTL